MTQFTNVLFDNDLAEQIDNALAYDPASELTLKNFYGVEGE